MNTRLLQTFVWLNQLKSFSQTADKLNTTQPTISMRIQSLEDLLGAHLYEHGAKDFELTPAGRRILPIAEQMVALSSELREVALGDQPLNRPLRMGVIEVVTASWLANFVDGSEARFGSMAFEISTGTSQELLKRVKAGELDVAFGGGPVNEPNIKNIPICTYICKWIANPKRFDCDSLIDVLDLANLPVLVGNVGSSYYELTDSYFRRYGVTHWRNTGARVQLNCIYALGSAVQMARAGLGVVPMMQLCVREDLESRIVVPMNVRQKPPDFDLVAYYRYPILDYVIENVVSAALDAATALAEAVGDQFIRVGVAEKLSVGREP